MSAPKEMKVVFTFEDGSKKEVSYALNPLRSGRQSASGGLRGANPPAAPIMRLSKAAAWVSPIILTFQPIPLPSR